MGPMFLFSFEAVSCFVKMNSITGNESSSCQMTVISGTFLSLYVGFFTTMSIVSKTVSKASQRELVWELSAVATMNLPGWQKMQGGISFINAYCALYLLSSVGVDGEATTRLFGFAISAMIALTLACPISLVMVTRTHENLESTSDLETMSRRQRSVRAISSGEMQNGMVLGVLL